MLLYRMLFQNCVLLFILGGLIGVAMEAVWWRFRYGFWQVHTTLLWSPLCTIYGFGCAGCYAGSILFYEQNLLVRFFVFALTGAAVEGIGGALVYYGLGMRAWDYSDTFLNIKGFVNLKMAGFWGLCGSAFQLLMPGLNRWFLQMDERLWWHISLLLTAFLTVDTVFTSIVLRRWSQRHKGVAAKTRFGRFLNRRYPDKKLEKRFNNWYFVDTGSAQAARTRPAPDAGT